jgi:hypothetical protein
MKTYGGVEVIVPPFLISALDGGEWLASRPRYPLDRTLSGPQSRSGPLGEEKNLALSGIELGPYNP